MRVAVPKAKAYLNIKMACLHSILDIESGVP